MMGSSHDMPNRVAYVARLLWSQRSVMLGVYSRVVARNDGATNPSSDCGSTLPDPVAAGPSELHGHQSLGAEPDRVDKVHHVGLKILD